MHDRSVVVFDRFLGALAAILQKAEAHCTERQIRPEALLTFRLFPDMLDFTRQVQLTCDFCARASARLAGQEPRVFPDTETTFADLSARVAAARAYVTSHPVQAYDDAPTRPITIRMGPQEVTLPGETYLNTYAMPQVFFHLTTAYNILRHNGVVLGKRDFMGG